MSKQKITIFLENRIPCFSFKKRHLERLRFGLPEATLTWCRDRASFLDALPHTQTALTWTFKQEWFAHAPHLRRIGTPAAGRDFFRVASVPRYIEIRNGSFHGPLMAETLIGMLLSVNRGILKAYKRQLIGELWPGKHLFDSRLIHGSHAVIIGFGRIGTHIGRMLKAFDIRITGIKRQVDVNQTEWFEEGDVIRPIEDLCEVLKDADHVIALLPSDTGTDDLLGKAEFEAMPAHAVVYNLGRGNCIDETALADALRNDGIAGACLDVFKREPLDESSPLADETLPGLLRMPHSSAYCECYIDRFLDEFMGWLKD